MIIQTGACCHSVHFRKILARDEYKGTCSEEVSSPLELFIVSVDGIFTLIAVDHFKKVEGDMQQLYLYKIPVPGFAAIMLILLSFNHYIF